MESDNISHWEAIKVKRILLLTASFGDGHNQAAHAIEEALQQFPDTVVKVFDYVEWLHPAVRSFAKFSLMQGVQRIPRLYGLFYKSMSRIQPSSSLQKQLNHLGISQMTRCIKSFNPDIIASTFPTPAGVVSELRETGVTKVPNVSIVTDYTAHRQWYHTNTDRYFVATKSVLRELMDFGIPENAIEVTGIPLRDKFSDERVKALLMSRKEERMVLGLKANIPVILLMGGGGGILGDPGEWEDCIEQSDAQFIIICGHNDKLYRRFEPLASDRVRVLGYTTDVDRFMAISDMIVTKPGGLTLTESLAMELPMMLFKPIPGQEERNAKYALESGAAVLANSVDEAMSFIRHVRLHPERLQKMRLCAKSQRVRGAALRIAASIREMSYHHAVEFTRHDIQSVLNPS
jgi:processive 1,2-diacylglycerol beta-glucosyltransferase